MNDRKYRGITRNVRNEYLVTPVGSPRVVWFTGAGTQLELMRAYLEYRRADTIHYEQDVAGNSLLYASIFEDSYRIVRQRAYELGLHTHTRRKDVRGLQRGRRHAYQNDS